MQVKITGFSEDDQTNLYNMAHDACGKGRQGLGTASRPKKVSALTVALSITSVGLSACSLARHSSICAEQGLTVRLLMSGLQRCQQRVCSAMTGLLGFLAVPDLKWLVASR